MKRYPLPHPCFRCGELVEPGEQVQYYANLPDPLHHACFMRPIIGSVAHLEQRCSCYIQGAAEGDDPRLTRRQAALAAFELWERLDAESMRQSVHKRLQLFCEHDVVCARCGIAGNSAQFIPEEGDEWECPPCNARENARERAQR